MRVLQKLTLSFACTTTVLFVAGCGTLFGNKHPEVVMDSDPPAAMIYLNGDFVGSTPIKLKLKNDKTYTIEFRKEGFKPKTYVLGKHIGGGWFVLDGSSPFPWTQS